MGTTPEHIVLLEDDRSGLKGVIVLHSTQLGPALGGCRFRRCDDLAAMHGEALRLAEVATNRHAIAGLPLGGGQAVLAVPERPFDRARLFEAFGRAVARFGGRYLAIGGLGMTADDMASMRRTTQHVVGIADDVSRWTARGVFRAMEAAARQRFGKPLRNIVVAVHGLGDVGAHLCGLLHGAGARLIVADPCVEATATMAARYGARVVEGDAIFHAPADIFAPCAGGGTLDRDRIAGLRAKLICGAADGVLATPDGGELLAARGLLLAPDHVVNAGGAIATAGEYFGWDAAAVEARVDSIGDLFADLLRHADAQGITLGQAADCLARRRIAEGAASRSPVAYAL
ncbi:Glu/Leu/Phe/Val dehydrogenase [Sphingomonas sp. CL5.1]|uniref:Glu/Leu/Phe/Val dehydrogenase family protein n=1 Tax=Sphingomonas sp. CL5.1 TaxID=2653203 RepID=UPI00158291DF|nr:Glu/Leu/Phe/Val dehydrogenase [Sphingomonas sp. CL5.1]QKR99808.1 Glu/Leu/Phe/Val dehydrogenase [Sphingomonas sp. CL5.1]